MHNQHYDGRVGWAETNPGWHEVIVHYHTDDWVYTQKKHIEILTWLYKNIDKCERHCRWCSVLGITPGTTRVKFRYERDYIWFKLTWG